MEGNRSFIHTSRPLPILLLTVVIVLVWIMVRGFIQSERVTGEWEAFVSMEGGHVDHFVFSLRPSWRGLKGIVLSYRDGRRMPDTMVSRIQFHDDVVTFRVPSSGVRFKGTLDQEEGLISGVLFNPDGSSRPFDLMRVRTVSGDQTGRIVDSAPPPGYETPMFRIRTLTPADAEIDYLAVMKSRGRIRQILGGDWPPEDFSVQKNRRELSRKMKDMEEGRAYTYTVMTPDESRALGCIYIIPERYGNVDAHIFFWAEEGAWQEGMEPILEVAVREWLVQSWPFERIDFPGRHEGVIHLRDQDIPAADRLIPVR